MRIKTKLAYFALGCAFVIAGQVLVAIAGRTATAQERTGAAEFESVTARSLRIVNDSGRPVIVLDMTTQSGRIRLYDADGTQLAEIGTLPQGRGLAIYGPSNRYQILAADVGGRGIVRTFDTRGHETANLGIGTGMNRPARR